MKTRMEAPRNARHRLVLFVAAGMLTTTVAFAQHHATSHADSVRLNLVPKGGKATLGVMQPHTQPAGKPTLSVMQPHTQPAPAPARTTVMPPHQQPAQPMGKPTLSVMQPHTQPAPNGGKPTLSVMQPKPQPRPGEPRQAIGNPSLGPPRNEPPQGGSNHPSGDRQWREHHDNEADSHHGHAYGHTKKHGNPHGMPPGQAKKHGDDNDQAKDKDHGHH